MREDIFITRPDGSKYISLRKVIGKGYDAAWFTNCKCRYRLFCGARSTKKSKDIIGYEVIFKILSDPRRNVLIARQNDSDNRQSTFENVTGCIVDLGLEKEFKISKNPLTIEYIRTGQQIIFRGLNNPTSLNGITFAHGYFTDAYIDEAFEVSSYDDFRKLDGSIRGKLPDDLFFQITLCFNAWDGDSWLNEEFFKNNLDDDYAKLDDPNTTYLDFYDPNWVGPYGKGLYLHKSTYKINEFRHPDYDLAAQEMKRKAPEIYKVEFLGMFGNTTAAVYPEWNAYLVKPHQQLVEKDQYGRMKQQYSDFTIGIDTGLSDGTGHKTTILKNDDPAKKIRAATTMSLNAITSDLNKVVTLEEYFHSNNPSDNKTNTDNRENLGLPAQADAIIKYILQWINYYKDFNDCILMKGTINVYVDSADIGFRNMLEVKAHEYGLYNLNFYASTKMSIQSRVDFDRLLMAYGDWEISDHCPNLVREIKNARKGKKGEAREDGNDHMLTATEYSKAPLLPSLRRWKSFKQH